MVELELLHTHHAINLPVANIAKFAHDYNLLGSVGSDFHTIDSGYRKIKVGVNYPLPAICEPIFASLGINHNIIDEAVLNHLVEQQVAENYRVEEDAI